MFVLFCVVAVGIPLGIMYALFGRAGGQPVTVVRRSSLAAIPQVAPAGGASFEPERVFAYEQQIQLENARKVIQVHVAPRGGTPPPLPRSRAARGTGGPAVRHDTARSVREDPTNPFGEEAPTMPGDRR